MKAVTIGMKNLFSHFLKINCNLSPITADFPYLWPFFFFFSVRFNPKLFETRAYGAKVIHVRDTWTRQLDVIDTYEDKSKQSMIR